MPRGHGWIIGELIGKILCSQTRAGFNGFSQVLLHISRTICSARVGSTWWGEYISFRVKCRVGKFLFRKWDLEWLQKLHLSSDSTEYISSRGVYSSRVFSIPCPPREEKKKYKKTTFYYSETHGRKDSIFLRGWQVAGERGERQEENVLFKTWNQYVLSNPNQIVYAKVIRPRVYLLGINILP